jgi:hypothetical protein
MGWGKGSRGEGFRGELSATFCYQRNMIKNFATKPLTSSSDDNSDAHTARLRKWHRKIRIRINILSGCLKELQSWPLLLPSSVIDVIFPEDASNEEV